jgi:hypothetical protein
MAEIQTNPAHVHQYGDINLGDVQLYSDKTGLRADVRADAATITAGQDNLQLVASYMYGYDGAANWERITSTGGALDVNVGAIPPPAPGGTIASVAVPIGGGATVPLPAPPANTYAVNCQNVSVGAVGSLLAVREVGGAAATGMFLPLYGIFVFDKAVALLEVQDVSGGGVGGVLNVTFEAA